MATLTSNISNVSLTVSGNTQKSTTISWTLPTVPSGATINSCTLTGTATASMSKGNATIKVNGTTVSSGSNFTINLGTGNTTSSVTATAQGGNKNASGTVTFSNLVYTVNYSINYTVTFVDYDGTVLKTQTVAAGNSATAPSNPSRTGYTFTGWDKSFTNVNDNLTVTAQYAINKYTVTFVDWDGTVLKTQEVEHGGSVTAPSDPSRVGYNFNGWDKTFNNITSNLTITALYTAIVYTVTFLDYDGSVLKTEEVAHGKSATAPEVNRVGYNLTGWSIDFSNVTSNITTTAQYVVADTLKVKEKGNWINIAKVYKKMSGEWVEQNNLNWNNIFDINSIYLRKGIPTAILYTDGTLVIQDDDISDTSYGEVFMTYTGWDTNISTSMTSAPWYLERIYVTRVYTLGNVKPLSMNYWFYNFEYGTTIIDISNIDTSNVSSMIGTFRGCSDISELNFTNLFSTNKVTNMKEMFFGCESLTSFDLSNFDTSNVIDMSSMFEYCYNLISLDLSNFDTRNVTNMSNMFSNCSSLTSLDLSSFDMTKVTNTNYMFRYCTNLQTIYVKDETAKTKIEASTYFPTAATVIIGKPS